VDFVAPGHTVNADYYCTLLSDRLRPAVRRKRPGLLNKGVILQHDNALPYRAHQTVEKIEEMGWELFQHPPYSPDLAPSDFHLFGPLKESLGGIKFENNEDVQQHVLLGAADKDFYAADFSLQSDIIVHYQSTVTVCRQHVTDNCISDLETLSVKINFDINLIERNAVLKCRETTLKSNITVRIV